MKNNKITISYFRKVYNQFDKGEISMSKMIELLNEVSKKESLSDKVVQEIHFEWGENWDLITDFFGQEMADKLDKAIGYDKNN